MKSGFEESLKLLSSKTGVPEELIVEAVIESIKDAYEKKMKAKNIEIIYDKDIGELKTYSIKKVVEKVDNPISEIEIKEARKLKKNVNLGDEINVELNPADMGRIAAKLSQQSIMRKIRELEKEILFEEYKQKEGQVVTGLFQRRNRRDDIIVELEKIEAILPNDKQLPRDRVKIGARVKVYIKSVEKTKRGDVRVILSRTDSEFVRRLFEAEVPEIASGLVKIQGISREAGDKTKLAVYTEVEGVDPVGACVGMKGVRIQSIIRELDGEKIDIIKWDNDIARFLQNLLAPAQILNLKLNEEERTAIVVVPPDQLSAAIGKDGKNVKLAALLIGWTIDIKSEEDFQKLLEAEESRKKIKELFKDIPAQQEEKKEKESKSVPVQEKQEDEYEEEEEEIEETSIDELPDVPTRVLKKLKDAGYLTIESIIDLDKKDLVKIPGISSKSADLILKSISENVQIVEEEE